MPLVLLVLARGLVVPFGSLSINLASTEPRVDVSLGSLEVIAAIRACLDLLETAAMLSAREKGATLEDIAEALGLTHQAIYYRFRNMRDHDEDHAVSPAATEPV
jgi:Bacterial regulatory proteins, tetR family